MGATTKIDISDDEDGSEWVVICNECGANLESNSADVELRPGHFANCQTIIGGRTSEEWGAYYAQEEMNDGPVQRRRR